MERFVRGLACLFLVATVTVCFASAVTPCPKTTLTVSGSVSTAGLVSSLTSLATGLGLFVARRTHGSSFRVYSGASSSNGTNRWHTHRRLHLVNRVFLL